jgi:hypothetical protein
MVGMKAKELSRNKGSLKSWARGEMEHLEGCEKRLRRRVICLLEDCARKPGASLPRACGNWTRSKAAYRCLSNCAVQAQELLRSHTQATWERMATHEVVLAVADTTSLNHTSHPGTKGLGPIHTKGSSARGMHLHSVLALSEEGEPLGLLHAHEWVRAKVRGRKEGSRDKNSRAPQDKESVRWREGYEELVRQSQPRPRSRTRLIMVGDREADVYELFLAAQKSKECCGLLVRAVHPRRLEGQNQVVWDHLHSQPESGRLSVEVPAQGPRPARVATLSVRSAAVRLSVPVDKQYHFGAIGQTNYSRQGLAMGERLLAVVER